MQRWTDAEMDRYRGLSGRFNKHETDLEVEDSLNRKLNKREAKMSKWKEGRSQRKLISEKIEMKFFFVIEKCLIFEKTFKYEYAVEKNFC